MPETKVSIAALAVVICMVLNSTFNVAFAQSSSVRARTPNIVVILLDDVGFGASSVFGGPARTPALEQLAARGLRYNRFHVAAVCSATRAALLGGRDDHRMGFGTIPELTIDSPGYASIWRSDTASVAEILRRNGYSTAAFGKWHNTPPSEISPAGPFERWPTGLGFEYFYGFMQGMDNQYQPSLYLNTLPVEAPHTPTLGYHLTTDITDKAINWLHTHKSVAPDKPYFIYFATGATHAPHHVPREWISRYRGKFDGGWDELRKEIFENQKRLGVVPPNTRLTPRPVGLPAWESLSDAQRRLLARQMEVFAAFLTHTDHEIARLLAAIQATPDSDNTLILYIVGDNGGSGEGGLEGSGQPGTLQDRLAQLDDLGSDRFNINNYSAAWGWATNAPFQGTKVVASYFGGTRVPLVLSWPARIRSVGELRSQFVDVSDVVATLLDVSNTPFPDVLDGVKQMPLDGISFAYSFDHPQAPSRRHKQLFEQFGNRAIYEDGWMAVAAHWFPWTPHPNSSVENDRWELYNIDTDFSQSQDLSARYPDKLRQLRDAFDAEGKKANLFPLGGGFFDGDPIQRAISSLPSRTHFVYHAGLPRLSSYYWGVGGITPDFTRGHRITAELQIPETGAEGVLITDGARLDGFALYIKDGHLTYESNSDADQDVIRSRTELPHGKVIVVFEFVPSEKKPRRARKGAEGVGYLYVNGVLSGEGQVTRRSHVLGALGVGRAYGASVSDSFTVPFAFTGQLERVEVDLR